MNGWQTSRSRPGARTYEWLGSGLIAAVVCIGTVTGVAQQTTPRSKSTAIRGAALSGTVRSTAGIRVTDATVKAEVSDTHHPFETKTDAAGAFAFSALPAGSYTLSAEKSGLRTHGALAVAVAEDDRKHIDLVLDSSGNASSSPSQAPAMSFSDQPNFTVSGVTDWTAVGGHGSDSILRTSEIGRASCRERV